MIDLSPQWAAVFMSAIAIAASAGAWLYALYDRRRKGLEDKVDALEHRVTAIDVELRSVPSGHSWAEVQRDIAGIRGDSRTTAAEIKGLGAGLKRVENQIALLMENELRGKGQS